MSWLVQAWSPVLQFIGGEMNLVPEQSGAVQVRGNASSWDFFELPSHLTVAQNGFIAIYISNEQSMDVWFDDLLVTHLHGRLLEEQHYYPHGLLTGKTVSRTSGPENRQQYQGKEMQKELGMQLYDFQARQYDPQIGVGRSLFIVGAAMSVTEAVYAGLNDDPNFTGVAFKAGLDIAMGAFALTGPVGMVIGGGYFLLDAAGVFGRWENLH